MGVPNIALPGTRMVVTGAARGIGHAVADRALAAGASVVVVDKNPAVEQTWAGRVGVVGAVAADLSQVSTLPALVESASGQLGGIDALIHVAGVIVRRPDIADVTEDDWDLQCDVNLKATFFLNRAFALHHRTHGSGDAAIVNFTSQGWWTGGFGGSVAYAATKGGIVSLTRGLARSLAPDRIRVNAIAPGAVDTMMMAEGLTDGDRCSFLEQIPMGRMADAREVAEAALFLVSDSSSYITGATLNVSGGQLAY